MTQTASWSTPTSFVSGTTTFTEVRAILSGDGVNVLRDPTHRRWPMTIDDNSRQIFSGRTSQAPQDLMELNPYDGADAVDVWRMTVEPVFSLVGTIGNQSPFMTFPERERLRIHADTYHKFGSLRAPGTDSNGGDVAIPISGLPASVAWAFLREPTHLMPRRGQLICKDLDNLHSRAIIYPYRLFTSSFEGTNTDPLWFRGGPLNARMAYLGGPSYRNGFIMDISNGKKYAWADFRSIAETDGAIWNPMRKDCMVGTAKSFIYGTGALPTNINLNLVDQGFNVVSSQSFSPTTVLYGTGIYSTQWAAKYELSYDFTGVTLPDSLWNYTFTHTGTGVTSTFSDLGNAEHHRAPPPRCFTSDQVPGGEAIPGCLWEMP